MAGKQTEPVLKYIQGLLSKSKEVVANDESSEYLTY